MWASGLLFFRPLDNYLGLIKALIIQAANQAPKYKGFSSPGFGGRLSHLQDVPRLSKVRTGPPVGLSPESVLSSPVDIQMRTLRPREGKGLA